MKYTIRLTFELKVDGTLIDPTDPEELSWLRDEILKVGSTNWNIINGEIGDSLSDNHKLVYASMIKNAQDEKVAENRGVNQRIL